MWWHMCLILTDVMLFHTPDVAANIRNYIQHEPVCMKDKLHLLVLFSSEK